MEEDKKLNLSFINQKDEEITKIDWRINIKFKENIWQLNCFLFFCF